jgi:tRNA(adenine34) deaminase
MNRQGNTKSTRKTGTKKWVAKVHTDSTHPPKGLFTRSAITIAASLASKRVSPKGPSSGMRMLNYFLNRAGRNLSATRRRELEKAKKLLSAKIKAHKKSQISESMQ